MVFRTAETLNALTVRATAAVDVLRNRRGADKTNALHNWVVEKGVHGLLVAIDDLKDAFGKACLFHQLREHERYRRISLRRFEDERIAAGDRWGEHPHRDHGREVERRDTRGDAQGLAHGIHVDPGTCTVGELALEHLRCANAVFDNFKATLHVAFRVWNSLAVLARKRFGKFVHIAVQKPDERHQNARAPLRICCAPSRLRRRCDFHSLGDFARAGERKARLDLPCCWVEYVGEAAGLASYMSAINEVRKILHVFLPFARKPTLAQTQRKDENKKNYHAYLQRLVMQDWDDLRVFLATARAGTLSGAGRTLKMDAATVGRRLARLDERMGRTLFLRSPSGYALTEDGVRLVAAAEAAEQAAQAAVDAFGESPEGLAGQVRIGAPDGCANFLLPQVCARISEANPELEIQIVAQPRVVNLSKREADFAISVSPPRGGRLTVQKIADYRLVLAASRRYLRKSVPIATRSDLEGRRMVGYIPDMIFDAELDYMAEIGLKAAQMGSNSAAVQLNLLRHGAGLGIVHAFALPSAPELRCVLPEEVCLGRSFYLLRHADDRHRGRMAQLAELLVTEMRSEIARLEKSVPALDATETSTQRQPSG